MVKGRLNSRGSPSFPVHVERMIIIMANRALAFIARGEADVETCDRLDLFIEFI
jgi:hypothetical protein